uniref:E4 n=1 Tax=Human papillomavirus type 70 TaxID=39457 RepID=T2A7E4_HPV70|nr:E4 [Human papillomavirus type 70]AGU90863.1 E4 [Human papillomavirus type 70]
MTLCTVPVTTQYPLLSLLQNYNTPPRPIPPQQPHAPKKLSRRRLASVEFPGPQKQTDCPWTLLQVKASTNDGTSVVVTLHL